MHNSRSKTSSPALSPIAKLSKREHNASMTNLLTPTKFHQSMLSSTRLTPVRATPASRRYALSKSPEDAANRSRLHGMAKFNSNSTFFSPNKVGALKSNFPSDVVTRENPATHQAKYGRAGLFPVVHFFQKKVPVITARQNSCVIRLSSNGPSLFGDSVENSFEEIQNAAIANAAAETSTRSVLDALKEISRKRIQSSETYEKKGKAEKRQQEVLTPADNQYTKRSREEDVSPPGGSTTTTTTPPSHNASKRICVVDAIYASSTSSLCLKNNKRKLYESWISPSETKPTKKLATVETQTHIIEPIKQDSVRNKPEIVVKPDKAAVVAPSPVVEPTEPANNSANAENEPETELSIAESKQRMWDEKVYAIHKKNKLAMVLSRFTGEEPKLIPVPRIWNASPSQNADLPDVGNSALTNGITEPAIATTSSSSSLPIPPATSGSASATNLGVASSVPTTMNTVTTTTTSISTPIFSVAQTPTEIEKAPVPIPKSPLPLLLPSSQSLGLSKEIASSPQLVVKAPASIAVVSPNVSFFGSVTATTDATGPRLESEPSLIAANTISNPPLSSTGGGFKFDIGKNSTTATSPVVKPSESLLPVGRSALIPATNFNISAKLAIRPVTDSTSNSSLMTTIMQTTTTTTTISDSIGNHHCAKEQPQKLDSLTSVNGLVPFEFSSAPKDTLKPLMFATPTSTVTSSVASMPIFSGGNSGGSTALAESTSSQPQSGGFTFKPTSTTAASHFGRTPPGSVTSSGNAALDLKLDSNTSKPTLPAIFGATPSTQANSLFGSGFIPTTTTTGSAFTHAATTSSPFGPSNVLGGAVTSTVPMFGTTITSSQLFGAPKSTTSSSSLFGPTTTASSMFGSSAPTSAFAGGATPSTIASTAFGPAFKSAFSTTSQNNAFASSPPQTTSSTIFANTGMFNFGSNVTAAAPFGAQLVTTSAGHGPVFDSATNTTASSGFGSGTPFGVPGNESAPIFGTTAPPTTNAFNSNIASFGSTSLSNGFASSATRTPAFATGTGNAATFGASQPAYAYSPATTTSAPAFGSSNNTSSVFTFGSGNSGAPTPTTSTSSAVFAFGSTPSGAPAFGSQPSAANAFGSGSATSPSASFGKSPPSFGAANAFSSPFNQTSNVAFNFGVNNGAARGFTAPSNNSFGLKAPQADAPQSVFSFGTSDLSKRAGTSGAFNFSASATPAASFGSGFAAPQNSGMFSIGSGPTTTNKRVLRAKRRT